MLIFNLFFFFNVYDVLLACLCTTCVLGAPRGQKMSGSLEWQLIDVYEPLCGCGESNPGPPEE